MKSTWVPQRPEYYIRTGAMFENPYGVPRDEILRYICTNTPENVAQVVFGKYVESSGLVYSGEMISNMVDPKLGIVRGEAYIDRERLKEAVSEQKQFGDRWTNPFFSGIDFGRQTDYTVVSTLDTSPMRHGLPARLVYWKRLNRVPWESIYAEVGRAVAFWGPNVLFDASGPAGDVIGDALMSRYYCPLHHRTLEFGQRCIDDQTHERLGCETESYLWLNCAEGYYFSSGQGHAKKELVEHLRNCLSHGYHFTGGKWGLIRTPEIPQLREELQFYTWDDKRLMTDCLFSLALAAWAGLEDVVDEPLVGSAYGT